MVYFLIGGQLIKGTEQNTWKEIQRVSGCQGNELKNEIEKFKLGNLDSLMYQNEQIMKLELQSEQLLKKIDRQMIDLTNEAHVDYKIDGHNMESLSIEQYLMKFNWDDQKFYRNTNIKELIKNMSQRIQSNENSIRQRTQEYQELKGQMNQFSKKGGSLINMDLVDVLKKPLVSDNDFQNNEYIQTLVAIVPRKAEAEFMEKYELVNEQIIPGSAKRFNFNDKDEYVPYRFMIMKLHMNKDNQKTVADQTIIGFREHLKITVKEFNYQPNESQEKESKLMQLEGQSQQAENKLKSTCVSTFSDTYSNYIHLKMLRLMVDHMMRFGSGQSEKALLCILKPKSGQEKSVQQNLLKIFSDPSQIGLYGTKEELEDAEDFFPFLYVPINIH